MHKLFSWDHYDKSKFKYASTTGYPKFVENNDNKNGFACRLILLGKNREVCISDRYGIAVYRKEFGSTFNVTKISTSALSDSVFAIPSGMSVKLNER